MSGRTPLFASVARLMNEAHDQNRAETGLTRRHFLQGGAAVVGAATLGVARPVRAATQPRIVIVGAGIAGLNAASHLRRRGLIASVYEGSSRVGGRMWSARAAMGPHLTTELGAETIDSGHKEMLRLVRRFGLQLLDVEAPSETGLAKGFYFDGRHRTEAQVIKAFRPLAKRIAEDQDGIVLDDYTSYNQLAFDLDHTPLSQYLVDIGATGFIRELLDVAYLTEYGCETDIQSALNFVYLIGTKTNNGFKEFGASDQRYKVAGGCDQITTALAGELSRPVELDHQLVAVRPRGSGFRCTFACGGGGLKDVDTDVLLLTLPLSTLQEVDITVPLPSVHRRFIDQCVYGTNSKVVVGFDRRYWRDAGRNGLFFTDLGVQSGWDSSQLQPGQKGSLTVYTGGDNGVAAAAGSDRYQRDLALPMLDELFPGACAHANGKVVRFAWPTYRWSRGSYVCFTTGQYTSFANALAPVGSLFFAGEHTSFDYPGYMEGGAATGKEAAKAIALLG